MFGRICSAQPMLQLTDQTTQVRLDGYVLCLPDLQAQLKATDVVAGAHDLDFAPTPSLNFGFSQADYWLKFTVQDLATLPNRRWVLELAYPNMDLVEMYVVDSAGNFEVRRAGDLLPLSLRELKAYNFSFRLNLPLNGQPRKVYLHFAGRDVKHFPLFLYEETVFFRQIIEENIFWGLYFGFLSIIFLYNLAIWVYVRERLYLYYLFYLASFIGVELTRANGSFGQQFFWPEALWFANYSVHFFTSLTVVSGMLFFSLGLNVRQFFPAFYRVMQLTVGMALLHLGAVVAGWETMPVIWTFSLALVADCLLFFAGVIGLWKGYRPAMLYVLATGSFFAGLIGLFLLEEGLVPEFWVFRHSLNIGSFLETVFLSLALAQSIRLAKDGQRQAEAAQVLAKLELENNRQLTAKLQELDQVKSRFFANISHEFRTPLTLILTPVQQWLTARQLPEPPWPALEGIRQNADSLLRLINQLLELSRLETGTVAVGAEPGDLADFLRQQLAACLAWAEAKQQALVANIPYQKMPAHFDHDKMERVVGNLLGNALKFTPPGGRVELGLRAEGSQVRIWVRDSGIGLAPEEVPKIFDRFYQVDSSGQRAYAGSGLGLALAKELVQLMGGRIAVESQAGKGSLFSLELPLQVTGQEAIEPEVQLTGQLVERTDLVPGKQPVSWPAGSSTDPQPIVLLVEDHPDLRTYLGQQLAVDYQVRLAVDGQQGLEMAREQIPDLVVSDLMMPRLDGLALCHQLKVDPRTCHIPVLMLTAKAGTDSKIEGLAHGADDYLVKPFELAEVRARVANLLAQRQRLRDYYRRDVSLLAPHPKLASLDEQFLQKLHAKIEAMIDDTTLGVEHLCEVVNLSRSQLHRKLQAITGQSATEFIRSARLRRAAHLLAQKQGNVSEIAYSVGYDNLSYFSRSFKEQYGVPPSEYQG
jgi:signal transduction histidine kinase/DNA-binding response OmpR family regulator